MSLLKVQSARALDQSRIELGFSDGRHGIADLAPILEAEHSTFAALRDQQIFSRCIVADGILSWSDNLDLAPEYLYFLAFQNDPALESRFRAWRYLN